MKDLLRDTLTRIQSKPQLVVPMASAAMVGFLGGLLFFLPFWQTVPVHHGLGQSLARTSFIAVLGFVFFCLLMIADVVAQLYTARLVRAYFFTNSTTQAQVPLQSLMGRILQVAGLYLVIFMLAAFIGAFVLDIVIAILHGFGIHTRGMAFHLLFFPTCILIGVLLFAKFGTPRLLRLIASSVTGYADEVRISMAQRVTLLAGCLELCLCTIQFSLKHHVHGFVAQQSVIFVGSVLGCLISVPAAVAFALLTLVNTSADERAALMSPEVSNPT